MRFSSALRVCVGILSVALGVSCGSQGSGSSATPPSGTGSSSSLGTWTVENDRIRLTLNVDKTAGLRVTELRNLDTNRDWSRVAQADTVVSVNGAAVAVGTADGFQLKDASTSRDGSGSELRLTFEHAASKTRLTRHYVCYDGAPVIETFSVFEGMGGSATVSNINAWRLAVPTGELDWVGGLDVAEDQGGSYARHRRTLSAGQKLDLSSDGRSTETSIPWVGLTVSGDHFFGGVMWSGAWSMSIAGFADRQEITAGLGTMTTTVANGATVEGPHGFFGVASAGETTVARSMAEFFDRGIRLGKPLQPLITYNVWFARGAAIDEAITREEIDHAAGVGAELYVVDAGWWVGAAASGRFDFTSGLGRWQEDRERFPSGLRAVRDYAHSRGLKFGIWVEPERFALELLGEADLVDEAWLAKRDGRYDPKLDPAETASAQICLSHPDAKAWVLDRVTALLDEVQPDYLKWDNNFWVNCNRAGHGHGSTDGNFAHVRALYEVLDAIRDRYPELLIENCSGGGHRLDLGLARYTDVAWMDDRTSPSSRVRHNLEGLAAIYPGPYLLSFLVPEPDDGSGVVDDLRLLYRSRMPGVLGIGTGLNPDQEQDGASQIALYRQVREIQRDAASTALTPPVNATGNQGWDAVQQLSASGDLVVFAYQTDPGVTSVVLSPKGLVADATYSVTSVDSGPIGQATGAELMQQGVEVVSNPETGSHVLLFHLVAQPAASAAAKAHKR